MNCASCIWWDKSGSPPPTHHRCFRYPPVAMYDGEERVTQWPWTAPTDFCGEHTMTVAPSVTITGKDGGSNG